AACSSPGSSSSSEPFLDHLWRERDDAHEALLAEFAADRTEDAGAPRVAVGLQDHSGVLVEPDVGAVGPPPLLDGTDDDRLDDLALLHVAAGDGVLHRRDDGVPDPGVATTGSAENADAQDLLGTSVVGDLQSRLLLNHFCLPFGASGAWAYLAFSRMATSRQRLVALSGRVSMIRTRSPTPALFSSSCAFNRAVVRSTLPYSRCLTRSSTATMTVLSILSLTT